MNEGLPVVGVDGCPAGWISAILKGRVLRFSQHPNFYDLWSAHAPARLILVDIPIGLPECLSDARVCDKAARKRLGRRGSSVFSVACRQALAARTFDGAMAINRRSMGKGVSKQAFAIFPKIREVDEFLHDTPDARARVREIHPEVCFEALAGFPAEYSKKKREGREERIELLRRYVDDVEAKLEEAFATWLRKDVGRDDFIDAVLAAVTAGEPNLIRSLPDEPQIDARGIRMEMVYRAGIPG